MLNLLLPPVTVQIRFNLVGPDSTGVVRMALGSFWRIPGKSRSYR